MTDCSYLSWRGRALSLSELGGTYTPASFLSCGAAYRDSIGHGLSSDTHYYAHGWEAWANVRLLPESARHPAVSLNVQCLHENMTVQQQTPVMYNYYTPRTSSQGIDLCAGKHVGADRCQLDAGVSDVSLFGEHQATVLALGAAYHHPFTPRLDGHLALAGFRDDYQDSTRNTCMLVAGVRSGRAEKPYLDLSATFFPCGIPLAGTSLSPAAMVGAFYEGSATGTLSTQAFGYVTLEAGIPF